MSLLASYNIFFCLESVFTIPGIDSFVVVLIIVYGYGQDHFLHHHSTPQSQSSISKEYQSLQNQWQIVFLLCFGWRRALNGNQSPCGCRRSNQPASQDTHELAWRDIKKKFECAMPIRKFQILDESLDSEQLNLLVSIIVMHCCSTAFVKPN